VSFYEEKRAARMELHAAVSRPARYYPDSDNLSDFQDVSVRLHYKFDPLGDMQGTSFGYAEKQATIPKVIFNNIEVTPTRDGVVSFGMGEAYQVDNVLPPDDFTTAAEAPRMPMHKAVGYPGPEA